MSWVKQVLNGVEFAMEVIMFMMFITEESLQTGTAGCKNAILQKKYDLAQQILDEVLSPAESELYMWVILYALGLVPGWEAYYTYWVSQRYLNVYLQNKVNAYKKIEEHRGNS